MKIITITGPSGVGKGYLKDSINQHYPGKVYELPWYTTRLPRKDEQHRHDRICVSKREFDEKRMLIIDEVAGHLYGLSADTVPQHRILLVELRYHLLGRLNLKDTFSIALVAHTDFLRARIKRRATEDDQEISQRIVVAERDMQDINDHRNLFSFFYEVDASNEHLVVKHTIQALTNYMASEEKCSD